LVHFMLTAKFVYVHCLVFFRFKILVANIM